MVYPNSYGSTAYGIWWNGGTSYTICGGAVMQPAQGVQPIKIDAFLVDYNSATGEFTHWKAFKAPADPNLLTHFEDISSVRPGVYTLNAQSEEASQTKALVQGWFVTIRRNPDGSFADPIWAALNNPAVPGVVASDAVYGQFIAGEVFNSSGTVPFQGIVRPRRR